MYHNNNYNNNKKYIYKLKKRKTTTNTSYCLTHGSFQDLSLSMVLWHTSTPHEFSNTPYGAPCIHNPPWKPLEKDDANPETSGIQEVQLWMHEVSCSCFWFNDCYTHRWFDDCSFTKQRYVKPWHIEVVWSICSRKVERRQQ